MPNVFRGIIGFLLLTNLSLIPFGFGAESETTDSVRAAGDLAKRVLGQNADRFLFETIAADQDGQEFRDVFELETKGDRLLIRGNNAVSMASGLNHYLKVYCKNHISWRSKRIDIPEKLPQIQETVRVVTPYKYRYYFNYCCFSYSLAWWDWSQWERMIDYLALNGINAPLSVTGQEGVWRNVAKRIGLSDKELKEFIVGPAFLPFGWMGCIDGWAGPVTDSWIDEHVALELKILERERQLGMTPILQGFTGHAPKNLQNASALQGKDIKMVKLTPWCNFPSTWFLDPMTPYFAEFGRIFVEEQTKLFGTDHLYASDTFIEMPPTNNDPEFLREMARSIYKGMDDADPQAIWVLQGWIFVNAPQFWQQPQRDAFFHAVPQDRLLAIDLHCEKVPVWQTTEAFSGQPWIWSIIQNFGGQISLHGGLEFAMNNLKNALAERGKKAGKLTGIGYIMEGLGYNPVIDEFLHDMVWRDSVPDGNVWIEDYITRRYGKENVSIREAWKKLHQTAYQEDVCFEFPLVKRPGLNMQTPNLQRTVAAAWEDLLTASPQFGSGDTYRFDLINVTRESLASLSSIYYLQLLDAFEQRDREQLKQAADRMISLLLDIDRLLATHHEFLLGPYLEDAKRWARTPEEKNFYEWNARTMITLWGPVNSPLDDYAIRQWSGILSDYAVKRWQIFYETLDLSLQTGSDPDFAELDKKIRQFQADWAKKTSTFPVEVSGENTVTVSAELLKKYKAEFSAESPIHHRLSIKHHYTAPDLADYPPKTNLTTGKPIIASDTLEGYPVTRVNDGIRNEVFAYWASNAPEGVPPWVRIDLEKPTEIDSVVVVCYYGDQRYYGFLVEGSLDGENWTRLADRRTNFKFATIDGYECRFDPQKIRYLKVTITGNSANAGRHLIEIMAFPPKK